MCIPTPFGDPINDRTPTTPAGYVAGSKSTTRRTNEPSPVPQGDVIGSAEFLRWFFEPGDCIELRAFGVRTDTLVIEAGRTTEICQFVARNLNRIGNTIAFKVNPVQPHLAQEAPQTAVSKSGVEWITDLYIDLDPERKSGMASADERALAVKRAEQIQARLKESGFSEPVVVDSGNGIHLHYRIDLPVEDEHLTKSVLRRLDSEFSDDFVKVDTAVADAARLARLPGTVNRKGPHTVELPWRACTVLHGAAQREVTARKVLEDFVGVSAQAHAAAPHVTKAPSNTPKTANAELIEQRCAFMRDCKDRPEMVKEPRWFTQLSILGSCQNAVDIAHERSRGHSGYDYKQTQEKIERAIANGKPQRCAHIQSAHGGEHCLGCQYNGKITSPIQLGYDQPKNSHSLKNSSESEASGAIRNRASGTDEVAQMYLEDARSELGLEETDPVLARFNSEWLQYNGVYWERINKDEFISIVTRWGNSIPHGYEFDRKTGEKRLIYKEVKIGESKEIAHQLKAAVVHPRSANTWLDDNGESLDPKYVHNFANGLLDLQTGTLHGHDPNFFCTYASTVEFDPNAPEPTTWLQCLDRQLCKQAQRELQKVFWYYLTGDMRYHILTMIWGDPRSFKSTIGKVLDALLGDTQCAGVELEQLEKDFGLTSFADVKAAVFDDVKMEHQKAYKRAISKLLSIAAHGKIPVEWKNVNQDQGRRLSCHLMLIANDYLDFEDEKGALAARLMLFNTRESFVGREDHDLERKVMAELPGILNWALAGRELLEQDNGFKQTPEGERKLNELRRKRNPSMGFFRECLEVTGGTELVFKDELYELFGRYTSSCGLRHVADNTFYQTISLTSSRLGGGMSNAQITARGRITTKGSESESSIGSKKRQMHEECPGTSRLSENEGGQKITPDCSETPLFKRCQGCQGSETESSEV